MLHYRLRRNDANGDWAVQYRSSDSKTWTTMPRRFSSEQEGRDYISEQQESPTLSDAAGLTTPVARRTDPITSHVAAESVKGLRDSQLALYDLFRRKGPMTNERAREEYDEEYLRNLTLPRQSESGLRTRRKELERLGWIEDTGDKVPLASGRMAIVWRAVGGR
jgi:hypothetical protein